MSPIKKRPKKKAIVPKKTKVDNFFDPPIAVKPIIKLYQEEGIADDVLRGLVEMIERNSNASNSE